MNDDFARGAEGEDLRTRGEELESGAGGEGEGGLAEGDVREGVAGCIFGGE